MTDAVVSNDGDVSFCGECEQPIECVDLSELGREETWWVHAVGSVEQVHVVDHEAVPAHA